MRISIQQKLTLGLLAILLGGAAVSLAILTVLSSELNALSQIIHSDISAHQVSFSEAQASIGSAKTLAYALVGLLVLVGGVLSLLLSSSLTSPIMRISNMLKGAATGLEETASTQADGVKEQAMATSEITTTIRELLATSRQITQSAQQVSQIAGETAGAAQVSDQAVRKAQDAIAGIKRQVDLIVTHMLDLGRKSQQIGGILEIINELAEQTNILSINATIESAGAGEAGKRFAVVADEIRKLADRVGGSTKEIRALVDEIRAAANTTVMATEDGSKAVDAGTAQFVDVASTFQRIAGMVATTTEAAREIELSTKQQTTAVEQVNLAIANVTKSAQAAEVSTSQMLATAGELSKLSSTLAQLIRPEMLDEAGSPGGARRPRS
jgi:methyl-accepting chemotaxis protein